PGLGVRVLTGRSNRLLHLRDEKTPNSAEGVVVGGPDQRAVLVGHFLRAAEVIVVHEVAPGYRGVGFDPADQMLAAAMMDVEPPPTVGTMFCDQIVAVPEKQRLEVA